MGVCLIYIVLTDPLVMLPSNAFIKWHCDISLKHIYFGSDCVLLLSPVLVSHTLVTNHPRILLHVSSIIVTLLLEEVDLLEPLWFISGYFNTIGVYLLHMIIRYIYLEEIMLHWFYYHVILPCYYSMIHPWYCYHIIIPCLSMILLPCYTITSHVRPLPRLILKWHLLRIPVSPILCTSFFETNPSRCFWRNR